MSLQDINYSGQYLDSHEFRIKIKTGADIHNATGNSVLGELFLVTGEASPGNTTGKLYCSTTTSTDSTSSIYHVADLITKVT